MIDSHAKHNQVRMARIAFAPTVTKSILITVITDVCVVLFDVGRDIWLSVTFYKSVLQFVVNVHKIIAFIIS